MRDGVVSGLRARQCCKLERKSVQQGSEDGGVGMWLVRFSLCLMVECDFNMEKRPGGSLTCQLGL